HAAPGGRGAPELLGHAHRRRSRQSPHRRGRPDVRSSGRRRREGAFGLRVLGDEMQPNLMMVLEQVGKDKGIDVKVLLQMLEQAILTAAKKVFGLHREVEAQFNEQTGAVDLFQICYVVEGPEAAKGREITKADAEKHGLEAEIGDELLFQIFYRIEDAD